MKVVILLFIYHLGNGSTQQVAYVEPSARVCLAALKEAQKEEPTADISCLVRVKEQRKNNDH